MQVIEPGLGGLQQDQLRPNLGEPKRNSGADGPSGARDQNRLSSQSGKGLIRHARQGLAIQKTVPVEALERGNHSAKYKSTLNRLISRVAPNRKPRSLLFGGIEFSQP